MTGCTSVGMSKPFVANQALSALGSVDLSCTVAYGPIVCWLRTVTPASVEVLAAVASAEEASAPPQEQKVEGHDNLGATIVVCVACSSAEKTASELSPTVTWPWIGSTQAKSAGEPVYLISS